MEKLLGVMLDCSRSAVMNVETVKKYADIIKKMGYNTLMLYTEDTYEVDNQPWFGHWRGRYSKEELKSIDDYCYSIGIEVVPCIQTLAHLEYLFKWDEIYGPIKDCDNILLAGAEGTYNLIEDMISTIVQCFRSKKIHIGMDEAHNVGNGKYKALNGTQDRFEIINSHLHRVCEILEKYDLEAMIWSDMFVRLALDVQDQYDDGDVSKILEKSKLPENVTLVYWDYDTKDYEKCVKLIKTNKSFERKVYFAGGAQSWCGFTSDCEYSINCMDKALQACLDEEIDGVFLTIWGNNGAECSYFTALPTLLYTAEVFNGNRDMESIKKKFRSIVGCVFDAFMLLDKLDKPGGRHYMGACKYLLYNDVFMGLKDYLCKTEDDLFFEGMAKQIHSIEEKGNYAYLFDSCEKLAETLAVKAALGIRTREAYQKRDIPLLENIIKDYDVFVERMYEFYDTFQKLWFTENKPHGFDVHDIRFGGVIHRANSCKKRLMQLVNGEINSIPELDEAVLDSKGCVDWWPDLCSPNSAVFRT